MYLIALVIFIILVGVYNIYLSLARRRNRKVIPLQVNIQVTLNILLVITGLIYLIFG